MNETLPQLSCIILAGGEGKRTGGRDKGLVLYDNKALIEHVIERVKPQVDDMVISANRNIARYKEYGHKVISDPNKKYLGPLAGIAAALPLCKHQRVLVVACDMPRLPLDLVVRLSSNLPARSIAIASVDDHHQLALLINKNVLTSIQQQLDNNQLKLISWAKTLPCNRVSFDDNADAFINLNSMQHSLQGKN